MLKMRTFSSEYRSRSVVKHCDQTEVDLLTFNIQED